MLVRLVLFYTVSLGFKQHIWQSWEKVEHYFVVNFVCITAFTKFPLRLGFIHTS